MVSGSPSLQTLPKLVLQQLHSRRHETNREMEKQLAVKGIFDHKSSVRFVLSSPISPGKPPPQIQGCHVPLIHTGLFLFPSGWPSLPPALFHLGLPLPAPLPPKPHYSPYTGPPLSPFGLQCVTRPLVIWQQIEGSGSCFLMTVDVLMNVRHSLVGLYYFVNPTPS